MFLSHQAGIIFHHKETPPIEPSRPTGTGSTYMTHKGIIYIDDLAM